VPSCSVPLYIIETLSPLRVLRVQSTGRVTWMSRFCAHAAVAGSATSSAEERRMVGEGG
jgi:hypothetical protein